MKKIDSLYFNEIYFKKKKTFIVQSKREFNEQNSITFNVCETEIKNIGPYVYKLIKRKYQGEYSYRIITYLNNLIINNKEISLDDYNKLRENNIGNEDIKTETIFYENGIIYKYIVQNGVKLLEVDAEKEFIIPKGFIVFSELENYDAIRKHIPIKKYMLKK